MNELLNQRIAGNTYLAYLLVITGMLAAWIVVKLLKKYALAKLNKLVSGTNNQLDDNLVNGIGRFLLPLAYLFINYQLITELNLHPTLYKIAKVAMAFITVYFVVRMINHVLEALIKGYMERRQESVERIRQLRGVMLVLKAIIWFLGLVLLLDNLGYDVATIIAGMGIGGIAIALAAQTILGDLFSYFVIFFDKPFETGDFLLVDGKLGLVEYIGIKTTRIRSLSGEQVVMSNNHLTNSAIHNFKRMERRRIVFVTRVTYATSAAHIKQIPQLIKAIIEALPHTKFDRSHLATFGEYSIEFETVYYIESSDYLQFMDTQQTVLQQIFEKFERMGIEFAIPSQNLFLSRRNSEINLS